MAGTILENLSTRKLLILVGFLASGLIVCFLIGGIIAPVPASVQTILGTACNGSDGHAYNDTSRWFWSRGDGRCLTVDTEHIEMHQRNDLVYVFQMPLPRDGRILAFSRWQQNLIGVLQVDVAYSNLLGGAPFKSEVEMLIDARLAYQDDGDKDWRLYASSLESRRLECETEQHTDEYFYSCSTIPLFELGALHHNYYLLNVRLPIDTDRRMNVDLPMIRDLHLSVIYQNGGFTKVWLSLKTVFLPTIVLIMIWFWHRVHLLARRPALLEYLLLALGAALTLLNLPLEYLSLVVELPSMLLLVDIRQGIFYATLFSFWLIFAGEHMLIQEASGGGGRKSLSSYWRHLSAVGIGCLALFMFDLCERGTKWRNPFASIWGSSIGANFALLMIVLGAASAACYFVFLCFMIWRVFRNIAAKSSSLSAMSAVRRLHYEGVIFRFKFLMLATLICAALTITGFILGQVAEGQWKWDENIHLEFTSAFFTGVYGMWNIYIFALMVLYAPSHKHWPTAAGQTPLVNDSILTEEIEFSSMPSSNSFAAAAASQPTEISSLTQFATKASLD